MNPVRETIPLDPFDLALAAALILIAGGLSVALRLRLERQLALASVRTIVQLLLVGYVLKWVFALETLPAVLAIVTLMVLAATRAAVQRPARTFRGATWRSFVSLTFTGLVTTLVVTTFIVGVEPWYQPRYVIPLLGMVLGNALTAASLSLDHLLESLDARRDEIEMELALGATAWEAARDKIADAVRRGMIPMINAMMVVGIVSLPGMMTGQILAGADPLQAVKYQIVVMFMLAAGSALTSMFVALLVYKRLFTRRHQLDADAIRRK